MERLDPKYERKLEDFGRRVLERPGTLDPAIRRAAASGGELPDPLAAYADTVRRHAYKVTDADVAGLLAAGYSEDQIFELTVAAAYGASRRRLDAGMAAMASSSDTAAEAER
jgi:alkylhydroperoxidase family enzyme